MELTALSNLSGKNEFEKALIEGYIEMSEINLLIARESFHMESEAYCVNYIKSERYCAASNDSKDGE